MHQVVYDHKVLRPILEVEDAIYWAERIGKLIPRRSTQIVRVDKDWLTENLPKTNPPASTRPGAEYGMDI